MFTFYSTCPGGMEDIAAGMANCRILQKLSGALIYTAGGRGANCAAFQNTYRVLAQYKKCDSIDKAAQLASRDTQALREAENAMRIYGFRSFRVMFSDGNKLVSPPSQARSVIEKSFRQNKVDRVKPDTELLILRRTEGFALFLLRMTHRDAVQKGELSPMVCACIVSEARCPKGGTLLDPFAGSGAIGEAALKNRIAQHVFLTDTDSDAVSNMKKRFSTVQGTVVVKQCDACNLSHIPAASIDAIATDPPWGMFREAAIPMEQLYQGMLGEFDRVLKPEGSIALLTADKDRFIASVREHEGFKIVKKTDVLINGKKAAIFVLKKVSQKLM